MAAAPQVWLDPGRLPTCDVVHRARESQGGVTQL